MAVAVVQSKTSEAFNAFGDGVDAITFDAPTTPGNLVVLGCGNDESNNGASVAISSISDGTNTYTVAVQLEHSDSGLHVRGAIAWFKPAGAISTLTVTLVGNSSNGNSFLKAFEISATAAAPADGTNSGQTDGDTSFPSGNVTPSIADAIAIGLSVATDPATFTADGAFTAAFVPTNARGVIAHRIVSSTTPFGMTNTADDFINGVTVIALFKGDAGGGGGGDLVWAPVTQVVRGPAVKVVASGFTPGLVVN